MFPRESGCRMADETAQQQPGRRSSRAGVALVVAGGLSVIGGAVYGFISVGSLGTGDLDTVPLGEQITFTPSGSHNANIFTPGASDFSGPPDCTVTTTDGRTVTLGEATPYAFNQELQMESSYGFDLSPDTTYLITCGSPGDAGRFAVVEVPILPQVVAIVAGSLGMLAFVAGLLLVVVGRRRRRRERGA